ncbi:MAG: DUF2254 domain-containing protein [Methanophagales archaeon]|nr:DUF2254 domain-containing protein [Methanophagales archaeon]
MQDRKEDSAFSVKNIREKVRDWKSQNLLTVRLFEYILLLGLVTFVIGLIFSCFNLIHTDPTSARYMLSALVQSQAAIIAIVVSLTLIAVQHTASAYSPRVIRIFRNNPDMWILLGLYGFSIFYGLLVLKMIRGAEDTSQIMISSISLEAYISTVYALGISTFAILCLYIWNIMSLLTPETIIKRLKNEITKGNLLNSKEDPIQPIVDIVHGSIMKYDIETTRVGLKAVTEQVIKIIGPDDAEKISERFCGHLTRVGRLAISKLDEESAIEVIKNLGIFGKSAAEKRLEDATTQVVVSLEEVGKSAAEKGLEDATREAVMFLGEVGVAAAKQDLKDVTSRAVTSLEEVGKSAAEKRLDGATKQAAMCLGNVGKAAAEKGLGDATKWAAICLGGFGVRAAEKRLKGATMRVAESLEIVGKAAAKQGLEDATTRAATSLLVVGITYVKNSLEDATEQIAKSLGLEDTTETLARALAELTILSEEIVKTVIYDYELELEGKDHDSFQKFMKIYKQELEKLQPGK